MAEISIVIRTKDEEQWIGQCLRRVNDQSLRDIEIVLVDNQSTDKTVAKARDVCPDLELVEVDDYKPGLALNKGIEASEGVYIVCLSAHCIPHDETWLENLRKNFENDEIAGVYGRQLPTKYSDPVDKRDLIRTFGLERRVQSKDTFFHNANSMIRRDLWRTFPFKEDVTNIEDQIWANEVINEGYKIVYEPDAVVYHHHGINQGNDEERTTSVVRTMESERIQEHDPYLDVAEQTPFDPAEMDVVAFIPIRQTTISGIDSNLELVQNSIEAAEQSTYINDTYLSTDSEYFAEKAEEWGVTDTFTRPPELSESDIQVVDVHKFMLEELERSDRYPDLVVTLEITHPFRPPGLFDEMISELLIEGYDSITATHPEFRPSWIEGDEPERLNEDTVRSGRTPIQIGLVSLACITYPHVLRDGNRLAGDLGFYELSNPLSTIEIRQRQDLKYWEALKEFSELVSESRDVQ